MFVSPALMKDDIVLGGRKELRPATRAPWASLPPPVRDVCCFLGQGTALGLGEVLWHNDSRIVEDCGLRAWPDIRARSVDSSLPISQPNLHRGQRAPFKVRMEA